MPDKKLKIVIADDHPMLLQGLKDTLEKAGLNVVGAANTGSAALQLIIDHHPDLAVLDIEMPYLSGFTIASECQKKGLNTKFIILSYHKESEFIAQAKSLNISGYVLKEDTSADILNCITSVMKGEPYYSRSILSKDMDTANDSLKRLTNLSPSERKILKLIASQMSSQEIANKLHIAERTVEKHRSNIIAKLGIHGQSHSLSMWAIKQKSMIMDL
ncbi:response regulator transcription factor [Fulvivirga sp. 29W222]|uniref:Response regulator transcription factor n=1 Tax=Fulvivirga marina TaxID=2494733 RepID=A0A937FYA7_9BACT|nr:response regulator transcription factor [Fulvivirga marina]MBL6448259.1 response regulator transcription factor [Fulvivirga marina]